MKKLALAEQTIWLACQAELRCEAIQALKWKYGDLENEQILIRETYKRKTYSFGKADAKHEEYAPMTNALVTYLSSLQQDKSPDDFVCTGKEGGMLEHRRLGRGLEKLCLTAGVERMVPTV